MCSLLIGKMNEGLMRGAILLYLHSKIACAPIGPLFNVQFSFVMSTSNVAELCCAFNPYWTILHYTHEHTSVFKFSQEAMNISNGF